MSELYVKRKEFIQIIVNEKKNLSDLPINKLLSDVVIEECLEKKVKIGVNKEKMNVIILGT